MACSLIALEQCLCPECSANSAELWQKVREVGDNSDKALDSLSVCGVWHLTDGFDLFRIILKAIST